MAQPVLRIPTQIYPRADKIQRQIPGRMMTNIQLVQTLRNDGDVTNHRGDVWREQVARFCIRLKQSLRLVHNQWHAMIE